jgi:integrase
VAAYTWIGQSLIRCSPTSNDEPQSKKLPPRGWSRRGREHQEVSLMPSSSSQTRDVRREPVYWRSERVPNLYRRRLAKGRWRYEFRGRVNGNAPTRRVLRATTHGEAVRELRRVVADLERRGPAAVESADLTVGEAAVRWIQYQRGFVQVGDASARNVDVHEQRLNFRIVPVLGRRRLAKLTTKDVSMFMGELRRATIGSGSKVRSLKATTRRGYLATLEALLRSAVEQGFIVRSPAADLPRRERPSANRVRQPRRLNQAQVEGLLVKLGRQFRPIGFVLAFEALRVSEALGLRWCDLDFDAQTLSVNGQLVDGQRIERTKTPASTAVIPLLPGVARELRAWRLRQAERDLSLVRPESLVFSTWNGQPQSRRNVHRAVVNAANAAGLNKDPSLPTVCPHDLRGSAGSIVLPMLGGDLSRVAKLLRHANPHVTARLYVDVLEGDTHIGEDLAASGFGA